MKFVAKHDIDAPLSVVWGHLSDFSYFESLARARNVQIESRHRGSRAGVGTVWNLNFVLRGKPRTASVEIVEILPEEAIDCDLLSPNIGGGLRFELIRLSPNRTRLRMLADIRPKTLTARLLIQSLRFAKGRTQRKLDAVLIKFAEHVTKQTA